MGDKPRIGEKAKWKVEDLYRPSPFEQGTEAIALPFIRNKRCSS